MGVFNRIKDPIEGTFLVTACSQADGGAVYENCTMDGVVTAAGIAPTAVHHTTIVRLSKWPQPGVSLPVTVDRTRPQRIKIRWDQVPTNQELARQLSQQQAQRMAGGQPGGASAGAGTGASGTGGVPAPELPAAVTELIKAAEAVGAHVTTSFTSSPAGGGLTQQESAQAAAGGAAALGLEATTARVLAVHEVAVPAGARGVGPGGVWDLTLDVAATPGYTTVLRLNFSTPERRQEVAAPGRELPVFADPVRHERVAIDTTRL